MQGLDQILGSNGTDLGALGARFGLSPDQTRSAMGSLMPAILGGMQKRAEAGGLHEVATSPAATAPQPTPEAGNDVLGRIFGSKDVSRQVADHAAGQSGISSSVMKAMLPIAAAMVAKHFAQSGAAGGGAGGLGGLLGGLMGGGGGGLPGGLGGMFGGGAGNPLDQVLGGAMGRR